MSKAEKKKENLLVEKRYVIEYKDETSDYVLLVSDEKETQLMSDGFSGYGVVMVTSNTIKEVEDFLSGGEHVKSVNNTKTITPSSFKIDQERKRVDITKARFPKKTGDWANMRQ